MTEVQKFSEEVIKELDAMKQAGMKVPSKAYDRARDLEEMEEYEDMSVSECADLLIELG